jgi:hypothetical protein
LEGCSITRQPVQREREEAPAHPEDRREDEQVPDVQSDPLLIEDRVHAQQVERDAQDDEDCDVGRDEKEDPLHLCSLERPWGALD